MISLARFGGPLGETILQVLEDESHRFWLTTNKGLMSVPRSELDALADGAKEAPELKIYDLADGRRSAEFAGRNTSAACQKPDGMLRLPSMRGLVGADPEHLRLKAVPP